jgi:hypothetical protein
MRLCGGLDEHPMEVLDPAQCRAHPQQQLARRGRAFLPNYVDYSCMETVDRVGRVDRLVQPDRGFHGPPQILARLEQPRACSALCRRLVADSITCAAAVTLARISWL